LIVNNGRLFSQDWNELSRIKNALSMLMACSVILLLLAVLPGTICAEEVDSSLSEQFDPEGRIIDSIIIDTRNIYEVDGGGLDAFLFRTANKLHRVTRPKIVERELLFAIGETYSTEVAEETARNLRTRLPFNDAWIETDSTEDGGVIVTVVTRDQWSLLGAIRISRDGNETDYQFGLEERNFLGRNQFVSFDFFVKQEDGNFVRWRLDDPRLWGYPIQVGAVYNDDPTNESRGLTLGRPFYDLSQQVSFLASVAKKGGRRDQYRGEEKIARWQDRGDAAALGAEFRWGSYFRKVGLGVRYDYLFETAFDKEILVPGDSTEAVFPIDSLYHEFQLSAGITDLDFIVSKRIDGFYYAEDITLEKSVRFGFARAFRDGLDGHHYNRLILNSRFVRRFGANIVSLSYNWSLWYIGDRNLRRAAVFSGKVYNNGLSFLTTAFRFIYRSDWRSNHSAGLSLGGKNGLRGFDSNFSTGDRSLLFNLEERLYPGLELLSVLIGGVVFLDIGRTWDVDKPLKFKNFAHSAGVGLRLSMERFTKGELVRIDLAIAQDNSWTLSFGSGQYF